MQLDQKSISAGLAAIGVLALAATGYVNITTPEAQQCMVDLADSQARREMLTERVKILTEAKDTCIDALETCAGVTP